MNILIGKNRKEEYPGEETGDADKGQFGDILAVSIIGAYTLLSLVISSWSAVVLLTDISTARSPIGLLVSSMKASGLV